MSFWKRGEGELNKWTGVEAWADGNGVRMFQGCRNDEWRSFDNQELTDHNLLAGWSGELRLVLRIKKVGLNPVKADVRIPRTGDEELIIDPVDPKHLFQRVVKGHYEAKATNHPHTQIRKCRANYGNQWDRHTKGTASHTQSLWPFSQTATGSKVGRL